MRAVDPNRRCTFRAMGLNQSHAERAARANPLVTSQDSRGGHHAPRGGPAIAVQSITAGLP